MLKKFGKFIRGRFSSSGYLLGYIGRVFKTSFFFLTHEKSARKILIMQLLFTFIEAWKGFLNHKSMEFRKLRL